MNFHVLKVRFPFKGYESVELPPKKKQKQKTKNHMNSLIINFIKPNITSESI